jgi:hypothetical protein
VEIGDANLGIRDLDRLKQTISTYLVKKSERLHLIVPSLERDSCGFHVCFCGSFSWRPTTSNCGNEIVAFYVPGMVLALGEIGPANDASQNKD